MLTVLLIEDDRDLEETIVQYLELESIRCDYAANGLSGLHLALENHYEVIILDLNLPRLDGLTVCQRLRAAGKDTPILMLTARDQLTDKLAGFDAGTDDYLVKPFELQELVARIQSLARRRSSQAQVLSYADLEMHLGSHSLRRNGQTVKLSPTGWKILEVLLRAAPDLVTRQDLENQVWGEDLPDSNSLKVHLHHLRKALDGPFASPLLHTVPGHGFLLCESEHETLHKS